MGSQQDYDFISKTYAETRKPLPWITHAISNRIAGSKRILDLGCGTGDYVLELIGRHPVCRFHGVDISRGMISHAAKRCAEQNWTIADVDRILPYLSETFDALFSVNTMHHLKNYPMLFQQIHRVLKKNGIALIFTDSDQDIHQRSQTLYFPETLEFNLSRYPKIDFLLECASAAGLSMQGKEVLSGLLELDDTVMQILERKALSELRTLSNPAFEAGMQRVHKDRTEGMKWRSQITMLTFRS